MIDEFVEQHRFLGNAVPRIIVDHVAGLASRRVTPEATPAQLEKLFDEPLPEKGIPLEEILARFRDDVAPNAMGVPSPRYFGQFNPTPLPIGVWADALSSMLNQNAGAWRNGPTSAMIEARVIRWLCDLLNYGPKGFGTLASGGSEANLIALKCARDSVAAEIINRGVRKAPGDLVIYASDQCHFSIDKSADILGLGREGVRKIPTDDRFHIIPDALREAIGTDREAGWDGPAKLRPPRPAAAIRPSPVVAEWRSRRRSGPRWRRHAVRVRRDRRAPTTVATPTRRFATSAGGRRSRRPSRPRTGG